MSAETTDASIKDVSIKQLSADKSLKSQASDTSKDFMAEEEKEIIRLIKAGNAAISSMAMEKFLH